MEFTVARNVLLPELSAAARFVETQVSIPILRNVSMDAASGRLRLRATDLSVGIMAECPCEVAEEGSVTLPAKQLIKIVKKLPDKDIQFNRNESLETTLRSGQIVVRMDSLPVEDFPVLPEVPSKTAVSLPAAVLGDLIKRTSFALAVTDSKYSTEKACLVLKPESMLMVATDGHRLITAEKSCELSNLDEITSTVSGSFLKELRYLLERTSGVGAVRFWKNTHWLFFEVAGRLLVERTTTDNFPDWKRALPKGNKLIFKVGRIEIEDVLDRVSVYADKYSETVVFEVQDGVVTLSAASDLGKISKTMDISCNKAAKAASVRIGFNPRYLKDFICRAPEDQIVIAVKDGEHAVLFSTPSDDTVTRYALMPMRIWGRLQTGV